jgi:hypothetical protein
MTTAQTNRVNGGLNERPPEVKGKMNGRRVPSQLTCGISASSRDAIGPGQRRFQLSPRHPGARLRCSPA